MSLKWFHIFFITVCVVLAIGIAVWAIRTDHWAVALVAIASGSALVVYRRAFLRKAGTVHLE
jgi:hypothetical protein